MRAAFAEMKAECEKRFAGRGIRPDGLHYAIEFEMSGKNGASLISCAAEAFESEAKWKAAMGGISGRSSANGGAAALELIRVRAKKPMARPKLLERARKDVDSSGARVGTRNISWGSRSGEAQIYRWESLQPGNRISGCAVIEGENTTYLVPAGWTMEVDGFGNGLLTKD